jgi:glycosyltransferase involved in cell wall biosynthesis
MRLGLLAYASQTGLAYQTKSIYDNLNPEKVMLVDLSRFNGMPIDRGWYPNAQYVQGIPSEIDIIRFLNGLDSIIVCETPLNYRLFDIAKQRGIKKIHQINPEFFDYFKKDLTKPDITGNPTSYMWDQVNSTGVNQVKLPVPFRVFPKKEIKKVKTIGHITGRPTYMDRNGTIEFLKMARMNYYPDYVIFLQTPKDQRAKEYFEPVRLAIQEALNDKNLTLEVIENTQDNLAMYSHMDLLVLPRGYAGLCLPMQEALGHGIPVVMTDMCPNNDLLPKEWLCKADRVGGFEFHAKVDVYKADVYNLSEIVNNVSSNIEENSNLAYQIALNNNWDKLKDGYIDICTR